MSDWRSVTSGVPQDSVLAPVMFIVYINHVPEGTQNYMNMSADDAKILGKMGDGDHCNVFQTDLNKISAWSVKWQMEFNVDKCHVMECGIGENRSDTIYKLCGMNYRTVIRKETFRVVVYSKLLPEEHTKNIVRGTDASLSNFTLVVNYMDGEVLKKLFITYVRPKLEYAAVVWCPNLKKYIKKL
ncbi:uncharacterized protein [Procambarus clarkii]|uniref:uncharacterized protein n=1 Tax=Procambarus clarkii TaxID=6728 RepID=UPI003744678B